MIKEQALNDFWNSFGVPAYDMYTVPDDAPFPRITYSVSENGFGIPLSLIANIYSRSKSWIQALEIKDLIFDALNTGTMKLNYDGGQIWLKKDARAERMGDPDDSIRHIVITLEAEYLGG